MPPIARIPHPSPLNPALSFLYQTPTILNHHHHYRRSYASDAFGEIDTLELKRQARHKISADWSRVNRSPTRTRKSIKPVQSRRRENDPRSSQILDLSRTSQRRNTAPPPQGAQEREWIDHVPFEGIPDRPATILDRLQGQTITRHEFNIFKDILAQGASAEQDAKEQAAIKRKRRLDSTGRARGVVRQGVEMPELLKPLAEEAESISAEKVKKQEEEVVVEEEQRVRRYREDVQTLMEKAETDVQLWEVWEARLKGDVERVLEGTTQKDEEDDDTVNLSTLTTALPLLLLHTTTLLRERFPSSPLSLSLLPSLRNMGSRAFTMGATTPLFNNHMRCLFERYTDLESILDCLAEMDRDVYEFDEGTHQLLADIFERAEKAGQEGGVRGMLWGMERKVRALEKLEEWEAVVAERIGRAEARRVEWNRGIGKEEEDVEKGGRKEMSVSD